MDGARFAPAVAATAASPADLTWRAGVDVLSLGGTKNGCWAAEAVIFFRKSAASAALPFLRKRAGHLFSKSRFVAAQFAAWLEGSHWLELATRANAVAARLAAGLKGSGRARLALAPEANQVFAVLPEEELPRLRAAGAAFYEWRPESMGGELECAPGEAVIRLVTSFATTEEEVDRFLDLVGT
jgi:threonine aldolase